jgi:hypothetical protein
VRSILSSPVPLLLGILAIPVLFTGLTAAAGSAPRAYPTLFVVSSTACLFVGIVLALAGVALTSVLKRSVLEERIVELHLALILAGIFFAVDAFALVFAIVSPRIGLLIVAIGLTWIVIWLPPRSRMATVSSSYVVNRSPDVVFAFLSDSRNELKYHTDVESIEMITTEPVGSGSRFKYRMRVNKRIAEGIEEIVDFEPSRRFTSRAAAALHPNMGEITLDPVDGGTLVTHRFEVERSISSALMGGWFRQPAVNRALLERRRAGESRIKEILESAPL